MATHAEVPRSTSSHSRWRHAADAQVMLLFAMAIVGLIGMVALSIDAGYLMAERRQVQNAADAAALAAARSAMDSRPFTGIAQSYGHSNAGNTAQVVTHRPPVSGAYAGNNNYIQVTVTKPVTKFFIGAVYSGDWEVSASAVAGLEPTKFDAALLALNSESGGIQTSGSTQIHVDGGSIVSNYKITTSGSTTMTADKWVVANDGFSESGASNVHGDEGTSEHGPEVPDPLADKISPPILPSFPGKPFLPSVSPTPVDACPSTLPGWWPPLDASQYYTPAGNYGNCQITISGSNKGDWNFLYGDWAFNGGGKGLNLPYEDIVIHGGNWRFSGGAGISMSGTTRFEMGSGTYEFNGGSGISQGGSIPKFELWQGTYVFTGGASISIGGSSPNNVLGKGGTTYNSSTFYFSGGGGLTAGGSNSLTLYPGTYIFDGGPGIVMGGSSQLIFEPGTYKFYFRNGADLRFSGSSRIVTDPNAYAQMYFYGGSQWSDMEMSGSTSFAVPSGEYYFDHGRFNNSGSTLIRGEDVFLYFTNGSYLTSSGSASFGFTAPTAQIYPGYYPGVFMYSDATNGADFKWNGSTTSVSKGTIYLPSSSLQFGGASSGKQFEGQIIVDHMITGGSTGLTIEYEEYVETSVPAVYLTE